MSPFFLLSKSNSKRVPGGTRKMLFLYVERVPSFREIGKAQGKQRGPWTIEGSLMYLVARENGNSRVNTKWSNRKDKGRQHRWKQKWGARLAERGNRFANACIQLYDGKMKMKLILLLHFFKLWKYGYLFIVYRNLRKSYYFRRYLYNRLFVSLM